MNSRKYFLLIIMIARKAVLWDFACKYNFTNNRIQNIRNNYLNLSVTKGMGCVGKLYC